MRLSDIKTKDQYWQVADIWYHRAKSLSSIWLNEKETIDRRLKAYAIFIHYSQISLKMAQIINNIKAPCKYPKGSTTKIF